MSDNLPSQKPAYPSKTSTEPHKPPELELLLDGIIDYAIFMLDKNGIVSTWNRGAERLKGYTSKEILGKHFSTFYPPEDIAAGKPENELDAAIRLGRSEEEGWRVRKDGTYFWANVILTPILNATGQLQGFSKVTRNVEERRNILETLRQSEERFRLLVQAVKDYAIFMLLPDGTIASWNEGAERAKGYKAGEVIGKNFSIFYTPEDRARGKSQELLQIARTQGSVEDEGWRVRKDGTRFWADVILTAVKDEQGNLRGFAKVTRDVTERKMSDQMIQEKQRQIIELQKMEAIGRLAGGIAHDFNNLVAGILGCAEALAGMVPSQSGPAEEVEEIRKACERATALTRQLMAFSRRQIATPAIVSMNREIEELQKMLSRLIGTDTEMVVKLAPKLPSIKMDPSQFQQVIINLVLNARDAMPKGGRLLVRTEAVKLDELAETQDHAFTPGDYCMLSITDTGLGMPPEVQEHIFEPFYTTKEIGKGTGLGLATVYGIIQQNDGMIVVHSAVNFGTTFKIFMPAYSEDAEPRPAGQNTSETADSLGGSETILVVEDDSLILRNMVRSLQQRGFTVLSAPNGESALVLVEKLKDKIDLVITDVMMPKMNGKELADSLATSNPRLPIIFISGFSAELVAERGILKQNVTFLEKPFSGEALARKVRELLGPPKP